MNKNTEGELTEEELKVMKAFDEGKVIQSNPWGDNNWTDEKSPEWDWDKYEYRVHPKHATLSDLMQSSMYNKYILISDGKVVLKIADIECITTNITDTDIEIFTKGGHAIGDVGNVTFYDENGNTFRIDTYYDYDAERVKEECDRVNAQLLMRWCSLDKVLLD